MNRVKIVLTEKQLNIITTALFEYGEICLDQGTDGVDKDGNSIAHVDKTATSYRLAIAMQKVSDSLRRQVVQAKMREEKS